MVPASESYGVLRETLDASQYLYQNEFNYNI